MVKVYTSSVINAPSDRLWATIRDFNALPKWHPAIAESRIEGNEPADKVGCVRDFTLKDGGRIRGRLLAQTSAPGQSEIANCGDLVGPVPALDPALGDRRMPALMRVEIAQERPHLVDGRIDDGGP